MIIKSSVIGRTPRVNCEPNCELNYQKRSKQGESKTPRLDRNSQNIKVIRKISKL